MGAASARQTTRKITTVLARLEETRPPLRFVPRLDPMDELVSCILSQHSADVVTFPTFHAFKANHPHWDSVAALPLSELTIQIKAAGLANQKAKAILAVLAAVKERFGDYRLDDIRTWPVNQSLDFLQSLPGVGPKTASIVLCFSFGLHAIPVDTHVQRVGTRLGILPEGITVDRAHRWLRDVVPNGLAYRFHVALIEHGRAVCTARSPQCPTCVVRPICPRIGIAQRRNRAAT